MSEKDKPTEPLAPCQPQARGPAGDLSESNRAKPPSDQAEPPPSAGERERNRSPARGFLLAMAAGVILWALAIFLSAKLF